MSEAHPFFETRTSCPVCGSTTFRTRYRAPYDADPIRQHLIDAYAVVGGTIELDYLKDATYELCECAHCGLFFQHHIPNDQLLERVYEHWIDPEAAHERHLRLDELSHYAENAQDVMQILASFKKAPASVSVLDFGMGWGPWALMAKAFGCETYGNELSVERVAFARANGITIVDDADIPNHQFDVINADQVFEHLPRPVETLKHLKRGLAPNGIIKIAVPRPRNIERTLRVMDWTAPKGTRDSLHDIAPLEHINTFNRSSLVELADQAGMKQVFLPLRAQYAHLADFGGLKKSAVQLLRPIYRNWLKRGSVIFLARNDRTA